MTVNPEFSGSAEDDGDLAHDRDEEADGRDRAADRRDRAAERRDQAADQRDVAAERRDQLGELSGEPSAPDVLGLLAVVRDGAAVDRRRASEDREAGISDRTRAESDRIASRADREASANEREVASVDDLTGAYLRGAGLTELEREMARARRTEQPLVLAFIDVDQLKTVNDSRGHAAGDRMLLEVANAFRARLRSYDLIIRYGGDEFVCAISGLDLADVIERLSPVNSALAKAPEHGSVTIGLAQLEPADSAQDLVARADAALYRQRRQQ